MLARLMQALPVSIPAAGRKERYLMAALDLLGAPTLGQARAPWGETVLTFDLSVPSQRKFHYLQAQIMRDAKRSGLYSLMREIRGGTFLDIGAHLGVYSLLARDLGFDSIAFEPDPDQLSFLRANGHCFRQVHEVALSDHEGTETFYRSAVHPGSNSLVGEGKPARYNASRPVQVARLDSLLNRFDPSAVTLVKIDVEAHEAAVVRGMVEFLKAHRPVIWCEVRGTESDRGANSDLYVMRLLSAHGYRPHVFDKRCFRPFTFADRRGVYDLMFRT